MAGSICWPSMTETRIRIFYPADPVGVVPGGVDTFLRGLIKSAPDDLSFSLVGMTTDAQARPVGSWTRCHIDQREFDMHPVCAVKDAGTRGRIPLSVRFMAGLNRDRLALATDFDIFDFHRIEPALMWSNDLRPKNAFFHQDPKFVRLQASDNLWRHMPAVYERLESEAMLGISSAWCVRETGVQTLRERHAHVAEHIHFIPTWVDTEVFYAVDEAQRVYLRQQLAIEFALDATQSWLLSVGRLDTQKDPYLMLSAFARLRASGARAQWLIVGDGVLRADLQQRIREAGLADSVHFLGLQAPARIAQILRACDGYVLSSAYEGMPMALLEALGSGLPAVVTDVGEVRRVVQDGRNGRIVDSREPEAFAAALSDLLTHAPVWRGQPARAAIEAYQPARVLAPVYDNYRRMGEPIAKLRRSARAQLAARSDARTLRPVVGVPVDVMEPALVTQRLLDWASHHESRYVCFVNVHSVVQATRDERHRWVVSGADLAAPDGAPVAWTLRAKGHANQPRVDGPGTMWQLLEQARARGVAVGLYGSSPQTLERLGQVIRTAFSGLNLAFVHAPPFRELTDAEDDKVCERIVSSGIGLLFVSLGCPKQELWMADHRGHIQAVMLGVGAAFDFHTGAVAHAPVWMRERGLEWLHRLASEPRRLWRRYLDTNTVFIAKTALDVLHPGRVRRALQVAPALQTPSSFDAETVSSQVSGFMNSKLDLSHVAELLVRVDAALAHRNARLVEFIASGAGEGTTTLARAYASLAVASMGRKVLVLGGHAAANAGTGVLAALAAGQALQATLQQHSEGWWQGSLLPHSASDTEFAMLARSDLWQALRGQFDEVVLDMPSTAQSRLGLMVAPQCDGVVVVLEAERTRAPVAQALVASLRAVKANLLGTVLNKRRFYLPDAVYRRL